VILHSSVVVTDVANLICAVLRKGESSLERSGSQECHTAVLTYKVCRAVNCGGREPWGEGEEERRWEVGRGKEKTMRKKDKGEGKGGSEEKGGGVN